MISPKYLQFETHWQCVLTNKSFLARQRTALSTCRLRDPAEKLSRLLPLTMVSSWKHSRLDPELTAGSAGESIKHGARERSKALNAPLKYTR